MAETTLTTTTTMPGKITKTYSSKRSAAPCTSSPTSAHDNDSPKRKRLFRESSNLFSEATEPPAKRTKKSKESSAEKPKQKKLTQLHFCIDQTTLKSCSLCGLTYTKGAPDDESLHRSQCIRIRKGMEWGREEEKDGLKHGLTEISSTVKLKDGNKGRIISFKCDAGGKVGAKLTTLLETINLTLSAPPLSPEVLHASKAYLFLLPAASSPSREKIVGCVIAQRIATAMEIASPADVEAASRATSSEDSASPESPPKATPPTQSLVVVDTSTGLFCHPAPLPTPMGIPRLFVPSSHRRQGIASCLLSAAAKTFIHGCPVDPCKGQVAFTQPTGDGKAVMTNWGGGRVRIYEE